jgi:putative ABC transport system permease protein
MLASVALYLCAVIILLPLIYSIQIVMAVILVSLLLSMVRSRYLTRISFRNLLRKRRTTMLLVLGLAAGMVMITSSLVISDTIDNIVITQVENRMAGADLEITSFDGNGYHQSGDMDGLIGSIAQVHGVREVNGVVMDSASVVDRDTGQLAPSVGLLGFNRSVIPAQLTMTSVNGLQVEREPLSGCAFISDDLARELGAKTGDLLVLVKGNLTATFRLTSIVTYAGLKGSGTAAVFLGLGDCRFLSGMDQGVNTLVVSYANDRPGMSVSDSAPTTSMVTNAVALADPGGNWQVVREKSVEVQSQRQYFGPFLDLYFIFDAIFLAAGAVLISNVLIMFAHERDEEMKSLRAMGMRSSEIVRMFVFEGAAYATLSSLIGVLAGCLAVVWAVEFAGSDLRIDGARIDGLIVLSPQSLILAFLIGLIIMLVIVLAVCRIMIGSNRAKNRARSAEHQTGEGILVRIGFIAFAYGVGSLLIGTYLNSTWLLFAGATCLSFSLGPLLSPHLGGGRSWIISAIALVLVWVPKPSGLGLPSLVSPGDLILSGLFLLAACLMVAVLLFDRIALFMMSHIFRSGKLGVISKVVFSNSARVRIRTGLGIAIFGLVVFTLTITAMVTGMVNHNVPLMAEEATGGMDIVAATDEPIQTHDVWARMNDSKLLHPGNITEMTGLYSASAVCVDGGGSKEEQMIGIGQGFDRLLHLPLSDFDSARFGNSTDVWSAVASDRSLVIIDGSLEDEVVHAPGLVVGGSAIGQNISIMDNGGHPINLTVAGVSKFNGLSSMFVNQDLLAERFGRAGPSIFLIKVADGLDPQAQSVLLEKALLSYGMYTVVIHSTVDRSLSDINGSLSIFQVQLFVGLGAGISGLVILTARSINERRAEAGIMRSIGFTRRMMAVNYCIETGLSAFTGVLIGVAMGTFVGYNLWQAVLKGMGFQFYIPWSDILLMAIGILAVVTVTLYVLVIRMSRGPPAENLRYE